MTDRGFNEVYNPAPKRHVIIGFYFYRLVIKFVIKRKTAASISNIIQHIVLMRFLSFFGRFWFPSSPDRFESALDDAAKMAMPATPAMIYDRTSGNEGFVLLVIINMDPGKPIAAIMPPSSLLSISGNCLNSDLV